MLTRENLEFWFSHSPLWRRFYFRHSAKLKRNLCLLLARFNLLKPFTFVYWLATYACNFRCPYCEAAAGSPHPQELSTQEVQGLIDDLAGMGVKRLVISGGEPLLRPDLVAIMSYAHRRGLRLGLVTNGFLVEEMWPELRRFDYFLYFTSLDGLPAYHDEVRGKKGAFARALKGLELFGQLNVSMRLVNTVVHGENLGQLEELAPVIRSSAANWWHLSPLHQVGRAAQTDAYPIEPEALRYLGDFISRHRNSLRLDLGEAHQYLACFEGPGQGKPFFCGAGLTRCAVMPCGEVMGCHQSYDTRQAEGNIREEPFSRIWRTKFQRFRTHRFPTPCSQCLYLDTCQGGCWAEWQTHGGCLKEAWEKGRAKGPC